MKHGHRRGPDGKKTPTYQSWCMMKERCMRPNKDNYRWYGALGVTVHPRWLGPQGFENFLADMGERPEGKTLDRENPLGNYEPSNCRWATAEEQARNKRRNFVSA